MSDKKVLRKVEYYQRSFISTNIPNPVFGELTYLIGDNKRRYLLTHRSPDISDYTEEKVLRNNWSLLNEKVERFQNQNLLAAKTIVEEIRENPNNFPNLKIAVHAFGAVPVVLTQNRFNRIVHGKSISCQEVIYIYKSASLLATKKESAKPVFIKSLFDNYIFLMHKYFEDIGKVLSQIINSSNLNQSLELGKFIEEIIARSIKSKLDETIIESNEDEKNKRRKFKFRNSWNSYINNGKNSTINNLELTPIELLRLRLFEKHSTDIFCAYYFRFSILYLLNEFYKLQGIRTKSDYYIIKTNEFIEEFDKLNEIKPSEFVFDERNEVNSLKIIIEKYRENDSNSLYKLKEKYEHLGIESYINDIIEFSIFLLNLKSIQLSPFKSRFFISYNHDFNENTVLKDQIEKFISDSHLVNISHPLSVQNLPIGQKHVEEIKTKIWQSDRLIALIAKDNGDNIIDNNYIWIAKECEHALNLSKKTNYFIEESTITDFTFDMLYGKNFEYLSKNDLRNFNQRLGILIDHYVNHTHLKYSKLNGITPKSDLEPKVSEALFEITKLDLVNRYRSLVTGILNQYTERDIFTLFFLMSLFKSGELVSAKKLKNELIEKIPKEGNFYKFFGKSADFRYSIGHLLESATNRYITWENQSYKLLEIPSTANPDIFLFQPLSFFDFITTNNQGDLKIDVIEFAKQIFFDINSKRNIGFKIEDLII
ncbi:MAG: hypothetical protein F6K19_25560 [Cyanothece sp. SIO1E1]|nr:hypothetical protein [Cyanothece sp. SIO1E1]